MKKFIFLLFIFSLVTNFSLSQTSTEKLYNEVRYETMAPLMVNGKEGLSGAYGGMSQGDLLVAGGTNFPIPLIKGGKKKYYDDVWLYTKDRKWKLIGKLPQPMAYGVSLSVPDGLLCIGGQSSSRTSLANIYLLQYKQNRLLVKELPSLPLPLEQMAGAYHDGIIYVGAGESNGKGSYTAYSIKYEDLLNTSHNKWVLLPNLPGQIRVQSCGVVQMASFGPRFYIFGGFDPTLGKIAKNGVYYDIKSKKWGTTSDIIPFHTNDTMALVGSSAVPSGNGHILFLGGVNRSIFANAINRERLIKSAKVQNDNRLLHQLKELKEVYLSQLPAWYKFNSSILIYQTITDAWTLQFPSKRIAKAGAIVVNVPSVKREKYLMVGGESKPGVRSSEVTAIKISYDAKFGVLNWSVLIVYLLLMILLGLFFMKRQKGSDDFFKGGGRIPWWAAGISIFATMLSAITYMSIPAKAYATNWTYYPMQICILVVSFPVIKYYLPFFRKLNVTSAYEYLEKRFGYAIRLMASLLFIGFMIARMALVLYLPSLAMTAVTGIDINTCIILMSIITIVYCTMGGMEAVVWGDVVQGVILVGGAFLAALYLIFNTEGGPSSFIAIAGEADKFKLFDWSFNITSATFWVVILGGLANNFISYTSDQTVIQRYLTTKDEKGAARGILTNGIMSVLVTIAFFAIGTGLYTFFKTHPEQMDITMSKTDAIFPFFMMSQLPAGIAGLLIAAIFAATMSTIGSNINSVATAFTVDIWQKKFKYISDKATIKTARLSGVISGLAGMVLALLMATLSIQSLLDYFNTILGLLSGGIGGLFLMGIFFPRIGERAALIGFIIGIAFVFYLNFYTPVNFLLFGFLSILVEVMVALFISAFKKNQKEIQGLTLKTLKIKSK